MNAGGIDRSKAGLALELAFGEEVDSALIVAIEQAVKHPGHRIVAFTVPTSGFNSYLSQQRRLGQALTIDDGYDKYDFEFRTRTMTPTTAPENVAEARKVLFVVAEQNYDNDF